MKTEAAFWDTSAVVPLCTFQQTTPSAIKIRGRFSTTVLWWGTAVEISSAIARLRRFDEIDSTAALGAIGKWRGIRANARVIEPLDDVLDIACDITDRYALRSLDALQLAAALVWCAERPRKRPFISADKRLGDAAGEAGFEVILLA